MRIALTALTARGARDVVINGDSDMTVASVARSLATAVSDQPDEKHQLAEVVRHPRARWASGAGPPQSGLWLHGRLLDPRASAGAVLHDGAVISVDPRGAAATVLSEPSGIAEVRVVGGPAAGAVHRLGPGTATLGSAADVRLADPSIPPQALRVTVERDRITVEPLPGTMATLDETPVCDPDNPEKVEWPLGGVLTIGSTVLTLAVSTPPDAHLSPMDDGGLAYNRPPRILPPNLPVTLEVPRQPARSEQQRLRLFGSMLMAALGLGAAFALKQWYWALFALAYPLIQIGEWIGDRRHGRTSYQRALKEYREHKADFEVHLDQRRRADQAARRMRWPDPAEVLLTATGPRRRLWERRITDPDTLHLRVGLADQPAEIKLTSGHYSGGGEPNIAAPPTARTVPVTLPLPRLGVIGLTGPRARSRALARWLVAQTAVLHSPRDLSIVVLSADGDDDGGNGGGGNGGGGNGDKHWNWVRWLPHCRPREGEDCVALVGADPDSVARRVSELAVQIKERRRDDQGPFGGTARFGPSGGTGAAAEQPHNILVVLDGARLLRRVSGMPQVLSTGPSVGVYGLCIDDDERLLPEECSAMAVWDWDTPAQIRLRGKGLDLLGPVLAEQVSPAWCDRLARALAPVRDVSREDAESVIPPSARLLELLRMPDPTAAQIARVWSRGGRTTAVPVGVGADGVFSVDLRRDGPHALIAGTTGAGKSELLQTLIASLAVANRPDEMTFVLIDYKGGAAFRDCAKLPHTVGMVTDLDGHLTERALESLAAELRRREEALREAGAKDIEDYTDLRTLSSTDMPPLPRLVLVIDEFAAMVAELPDFVSGLVDIGRRGRSLGIHLILATQRPAGVVTGDIRANTNLRIALRVTAVDESSDVIDDPAAARISKSTPGRCYLRSGASAPVPVQAARIGGRRPGRSGPAVGEVSVVPLPWAALGRPLPLPAAVPDEATMITDLAVLVEAVREAASLARVPEQLSPWLDPLPELVTLESVPVVTGEWTDVAPIPFGLTDLPASQSRAALSLDLVHGGHLYVAGSTRSGRSTVLRTLAGSLAAGCAPSDVHVYAIDCGANALLPLVALPHCGAVVGRDQVERMERLLARLQAEVSRRQRLLAERGFASLAEQRTSAPSDERLPWMLLMLDRWEGFVAAFEHYDYGRLIDTVLRLLREGAAVGLRGVFTGDRTGFTGRVSTVFDKRLVLRMSDPNDYAYAGLSERAVPSHMPAGRVLEAVDPTGRILRESHIALLADDPSGTTQVSALRRLARAAEKRYERPARGLRPLRVDELPVRVTYAEISVFDPDFRAPSPLWALVGAGGDRLGPVGIDLRDEGPGFTVAGLPRSGRSTALLTMVQSLLDPHIGEGIVPVVLITPRRSPLRMLAGHEGVLDVLGTESDAATLSAAVAGHERYVIVADDAELLADSDLDGALERQLRTARDGEHGVIVAGTTDELGSAFSGFIPAILRSRSGLLLTVHDVDDGKLLGVRLPRNAGAGGPTGRGALVSLGITEPVQVALPSKRRETT